MTISKEIFGIEPVDFNSPKLRNKEDFIIGYANGVSDTCNFIDEYELSEEELAKIIKEKLGCDTLCVGEAEYVAKAIIQNQSKIFVRKTK